jgi:hypothetical protein
MRANISGPWFEDDSVMRSFSFKDLPSLGLINLNTPNLNNPIFLPPIF